MAVRQPRCKRSRTGYNCDKQALEETLRTKFRGVREVEHLYFGYVVAMETPGFSIRDETKSDHAAITEVTAAAFESMEISNQTEHLVINALRSAGALTLSLVAEVDGRVVGHIAFSPVVISDGTDDWYGLGPVSVLPKYQQMGIGKALIEEGLSRIRKMNGKGCCLVGHPQYYRKFGFKNVSGLVLNGVPPEVFFALSFDDHYPQGQVVFHQAFKAET